MGRIKVSVIIPVYGVEKFIKKCARSLFNQTMQEGIEFIFVNDATKDKSIEIVEKLLVEYPYRKEQVRIIHNEENQGLAETRYIGVKEAKGDYLIHCDSDDWIAPDMYKQLYNKAIEEDADIVGCDAYYAYEDRMEYLKQEFLLPHTRLISEMINRNGRIKGYLWNRLIRSSLYKSKPYRADKGITLWEDMAVVLPLHMATNKVAYVPEALYYYRRGNSESLSFEYGKKNLRSALRVLNKLSKEEYLQSWKKNINYRKRAFLLSRLATKDMSQIEKWKACEYSLLSEINSDLSWMDKMRIWLTLHNQVNLQYLIYLFSRVFRVCLLLNQIKH